MGNNFDRQKSSH